MHKYEMRFGRVIRLACVIPMLLLGGCFSEDDIRTLTSDAVGLVLSIAEMALNNMISTVFDNLFITT